MAEARREGWRVSLTAKRVVLAFVLALAGLVAGCGQPPSEGSASSEGKVFTEAVTVEFENVEITSE